MQRSPLLRFGGRGFTTKQCVCVCLCVTIDVYTYSSTIPLLQRLANFLSFILEYINDVCDDFVHARRFTVRGLSKKFIYRSPSRPSSLLNVSSCRLSNAAVPERLQTRDLNLLFYLNKHKFNNDKKYRSSIDRLAFRTFGVERVKIRSGITPVTISTLRRLPETSHFSAYRQRNSFSFFFRSFTAEGSTRVHLPVCSGYDE